MRKARILLLYSLPDSGHYHACLAIEAALRAGTPPVSVTLLDSLMYTSPVVARLIKRTYLGLIRTRPDVWEYLYDNADLVERTRTLRELFRRHHSSRFRTLIDHLTPDVIACTQAFPCTMIAELKRSGQLGVPLVAVLTDYLPHAYWLDDAVDQYFVPTAEAEQVLGRHGVAAHRITVCGIPVHPQFALNSQPRPPGAGDTPIVLIMGGDLGLGPIREIVRELDRLTQPCRLVVLAGKNRSLWRWCARYAHQARHPVEGHGFTASVAYWMHRATLLVTKPGGMTTAEALACQLPMVLVNPIPGQETKNTQVLLQYDVAVQASGPRAVASLVDTLLHTPAKRAQMRERARRLGHPHAAVQIAAHLRAIVP